jgi:hypothetical protein
VKVQFERQPPEVFSEGTAEPWCADFVSWVMYQAGFSLDNPDSGSWRIPGVGHTVGGNEGAIRIRRSDVGSDLHLLGYGSLD